MVIRLYRWILRLTLAFILGGVLSASAAFLPVFTGTPTITGSAFVGNVLNVIDAAATDADAGDIVTISYQWLAGGTPISGAINDNLILSTQEAHASISVEVTADDSNDGAVTFTTAAVPVENSLPVISGTPATTVNEDTSYSFTPAVSDLDGDTQTFTIENRPGWAIFDAATGTLSGTPTNANVGTTINIVITTTDTEPASDSLASFNLEVINTNDAPVITSTEITAASEDTTYSYTFTATDVDVGDALTYSAPVLPAWLGFDIGTGALTGLPDNDDVGDHAVTLRVFDGTVNVDQSFTVTVANTNDLPVITSSAVTAATEEVVYSYTFSASDVDVGDTLTYSAQLIPAWLSFDIGTGALTGTPLNADVGDHAVTLRVFDGTANVDQSFTITVTNTNDLPVVTSIAVTTIDEDDPYSYTFIATDSDVGDTLTYSAQLLPAWLSFNIGTGELTGTPVNADVGDHAVTLRVFDGTVNVDQSFTVTVANTNDAPVISGSPGTSVLEDTPYSFTPDASDVDVGDGLVFSIGNRPTWASFDSVTGTLSGTPTNADVDTTDNILITVNDTANPSASDSLPFFNLQVINTNDAPVVTSTAVTAATEEVAYSYTFAANDVDVGDTLTYSALPLPAWLSFNIETGELTGTPTNADVGDHAVTLRVSDSTANVDQSFTITVANTNDLPVITSTEITVATEDAAYSYTFAATDDDVADVLIYSAPVLPTWLTFTAATGELTGIPVNADVGDHAVTLRVFDGTVNVDQSFTISVSNTNDLPVITSTEITVATEEVAYSYTFVATDEDVADVLTYSAQLLPVWLVFDIGTGTLTGTPVNVDVGDHAVTLRVFDGTVNVDQSFTITVSNTNDLPVITSTAVTAATEEVLYSYTFSATDADASDILTYSAPTLPAWLGFNASTGELTGTPLNADVGDNAVTLRVFDGIANVDQSFTITVANVNDAPTIVGAPTTTVAEGDAYIFTPVAADVDAGDSLTFSILNQPGWASFDSVTGTLSGTPTNSDVGFTNNIVITVTDLSLASVSLAAFNLEVTNTNNLPVITSTAITAATEDLVYTYVFSATDDDVGDTLIYSAPVMPAWLSFNALTGILSGTPVNADVGDYGITLSVFDGTVNVDQSFTVTVTNTNDLPVVTSTALTAASEDAAYSYTFVATDVDVADVLTYSAPVLPSWLVFNTTSGELAGTPSNAVVGDHAVTLRVFDGTVNVDQSFTISVSNTNDLPVITSTAVTAATEEVAYSYTFSATDGDAGDVLTYSAVLIPEWLTFNAGTGELTGTPLNATVGDHSVTLRVFDGAVNVDQSFIITVANTNDLPEISSVAVTAATEEVLYSYSFSATDADASDTLAYSAVVIPTWLTFDALTGELTGTPLNDNVGDHAVILQVSDGTADVDQSFTITVSNTNDAPVITSEGITTATEEQAYSYTFVATDVDVGDVLTYSGLQVPSWLVFNASTGELSGTPLNDDVGSYLVTLSVSDDQVSLDQSFLIIVANVNDAAVITSTALTSVEEDTAYSYTITATDVDATDVLIYSAPVLPAWLSFNVSTGELTGLPGNADVGDHLLTLRVFDGTINTDQNFTINVSNVNDAPTIGGIPGTLVAESNPYSFTPTATDVDVGDILTFSIINQPGWTSFNTTTGTLSGIPGNGDVGVTTGIVITVTDGSLVSASLPAFDLNVNNTNNAPTISGTPAISVVEDTAYSFTPVANDVDIGETLAFSILNAPGWADFDAATGTLSGTPDNSHVGVSNNIVITVTDGSSASDSLAAFNLQVINSNDVPVITSTANTVSVEDFAYSYNFTATDVDLGDSLTYSAPVLPAWLSFNTTTGLLSGTPDNTLLGNHDVTLQVNDGTVDVEQSFVISVANSNDAPVIDSVALTNATEDTLYSYTLLASDIDMSDVLSYGAPVLPSWLDFNPATAVLSGIPDNDDVGTHNVTLRVNDGSVNVDQVFSVTVSNVNDSPVISSVAITTVAEDSVYSYSFNVSDVDVGDVLTYSAPQLPAWLSFDEATQVLSGTPANTDVGGHAVTLSVTDGNATVNQGFIITVGNSNDAPVISSEAVTAATEDLAYSYQLTATDVDAGDVLTYSAPILPAWLTFTTNTGLLTGLPANADVGNHTVTLRVSDGSADADQTFVLVVSNVNDEPVITSTAVTIATEEMAYSYVFAASDVDVGDVLNYSAQTIPSWLSFNASTGLLSGMPTNSEVGIHLVTLRVNDGSVNVPQSFLITVSNANDAPAISGTPVTSTVEGLLYSFQAIAVDADVSDNLTFTIVNRPVWAEFNNSSGLLSGTPAAVHVGTTSDIVISVSDGSITAVLPAFNLTVFSDLNGDGVADVADLDGDGMDNEYELSVGLDPLDPSDGLLDADGDGKPNAEEFLAGSDPFADDQAPIVIAPADITIVATGFVTLVDFGAVTAVDSADGNLTASTDTDNHLQPGTHTIIWSATDGAGNTGMDLQIIHVIPLVDFANDQIGAEGNVVSVKVTLNGQAVSYPVEVPYTVSGTATIGDDHDLADGTVVINSGTEALINFNINNDGAGDADETIIISMGTPENAAVGIHSEHTVKIIEGNASPQVTLTADQLGITRIISQQGGPVVVNANVSDANTADVHSYDWSGTDNALIDTDQDNDRFSFDPLTVSPGLYLLQVAVSDGSESDEETLSLLILATVPVFTSADSDGDGISDQEEGLGDTDNDGVPNYLDAISAGNILQGLGGSSDQGLMETEPGLALALGLTAFQSQQGQAVVSADEIESFGAGPLDIVPNIGGIFDFVITGLTEAGDSVRIVLPQLVAIPADAGFRKLMPTGWQDFIVDDKNMIFSAAGESGYCPPPGDDAYTSGLTEGHWCVQLLIEDGGPNDADLMADQQVHDPGGLAQLATIDVSVESSGAAVYLLIMILLLWRVLYIIEKNIRFKNEI